MLTFLLKLTLCWGLFALLYTLLLRGETFFRANRAFLLLTALVSLLLAGPAGFFPVESVWAGPVLLPEFSVGLQAMEQQTTNVAWLSVLWWVYGAGAVLAAARTGWGLYRLYRMYRAAEKQRLPDGCVLVRTEDSSIPFSFFHWLFVPAAFDESPEGYASMLEHERAHAHGWHSADVLLMEVLGIVFWFHPLAHWYRRALRTVHEYLADASAVRHADRKQYGLLLIRQMQGGMPVAFANHFFQSPLKQRILMLTRRHSPAEQGWKYALTLPLIVLFALLFRQAPALAQELEAALAAPALEVLPIAAPVKTTIATQPAARKKTAAEPASVSEPVVSEDGAESQPEFPGGMSALIQYLSTNIRYPDAARADNAQGTVVVDFVVNKDGSVSDAQVTEAQRATIHAALQEESVRIVGAMPAWKPALHDGQPVRYRFHLPIRFKLE